MTQVASLQTGDCVLVKSFEKRNRVSIGLIRWMANQGWCGIEPMNGSRFMQVKADQIIKRIAPSTMFYGVKRLCALSESGAVLDIYQTLLKLFSDPSSAKPAKLAGPPLAQSETPVSTEIHLDDESESDDARDVFHHLNVNDYGAHSLSIPSYMPTLTISTVSASPSSSSTTSMTPSFTQNIHDYPFGRIHLEPQGFGKPLASPTPSLTGLSADFDLSPRNSTTSTAWKGGGTLTAPPRGSGSSIPMLPLLKINEDKEHPHDGYTHQSSLSGSRDRDYLRSEYIHTQIHGKRKYATKSRQPSIIEVPSLSLKSNASTRSERSSTGRHHRRVDGRSPLSKSRSHEKSHNRRRYTNDPSGHRKSRLYHSRSESSNTDQLLGTGCFRGVVTKRGRKKKRKKSKKSKEKKKKQASQDWHVPTRSRSRSAMERGDTRITRDRDRAKKKAAKKGHAADDGPNSKLHIRIPF